MCGIAGIVDSDRVDQQLIEGMISMLSHRGPDERGYYLHANVALGSSRLSIVDIAGGCQPIENESRTLVIVMNGEIYNYRELALELSRNGHALRSRCDTEVALHLYEEHGPAFVHRLNGQFAIAIWDKLAQKLILVRDRPGIRPLFYFHGGGRLLFGSEIKALFTDRRIRRELNPLGIDQIFTFWTMIGDTTCFAGVKQVPPGCYIEYQSGHLSLTRYWDYPLGADGEKVAQDGKEEEHYLDAFKDKLATAVRLRLRADVEVGAYLSGGIDSSAIGLLAQEVGSGRLRSYSVGFTDPLLDESPYQRRIASHLGTRHKSIECSNEIIGRDFPSVVWHCEQPVFRTAPTPLYLLSELVHNDGIKVVLTGEGSDEILWGYDLYKEAKIRRFWSKNPSSSFRPLLLRKLYGHLPQYRSPRYFALLVDFYREELGKTGDPYYSHLPRWRNSMSQKAYYAAAFREKLQDYDALEHLGTVLPEGFSRLSANGKAQYLECHTLLAGYLLSSQGDRMSMAHSVEGRYPFLDHELIEFCATLPAKYKLRGMKDKYLLRRAFSNELPQEIVFRPKHAYQAPEIRCFVNKGQLLDYVREVTSKRKIDEAGVFDDGLVGKLIEKALRVTRDRTGTRNNLAFVQILSTQLLYQLFIQRFPQPNVESDSFHVLTEANSGSNRLQT